MRLDGQVAIVTGASSGIGAAVATALAAAGARTVVNFRSQADRAAAVVARIEAVGGEAVAIGADVSQPDQVDRLFAEAATRFGRLDVLVANSGIQRDAPFRTMTPEDWQRVIDVNLTGQFLCCQAAVRRFCAQPRDPALSRAAGKIVCMSSVHETIPWAGHANYAASKGGVMLMMRSLAQEVAADGIRVNAVAPGAIRTPINRDSHATEEAERRLLALIPYGRIGEPEDVARAVLWLASDESDYVTGTTLTVDGGMTLYPAFRENG